MKILFIIGCSSKKAKIELQVKDFYKGQLFLMLKRLCEQNSFDYCLISGKLGLLKPNDLVKPYDMRIKTRKDILRVRELTNGKLEREINEYDKIIVLMGKKYRDVITPLINDKFTIIIDERGIFGYLAKVSLYLKQSKKEFLDTIKKYEVKLINYNYEGNNAI